MTGFRGVALVAERELLTRGRSKSYLFSTVAMVLVVVGLIVLPGLFGGGADDYQIGVVGVGREVVETAGVLSAERAEEGEDPDTYTIVEFATEEEASTALDDGEVEAVLIDGEALLVRGGGFFGPSSVAGTLQEAAGTLRLQEVVAGDEGIAEVIAILSSEPLEVRTLGGADDAASQLQAMVAFGGMVLIYVAILLYGGWMLSAVTEEKTSRVVEVVLSTFRPWQVFAGKLAGIGLLGCIQLLVVLGAALVAFLATSDVEVPDLPLDSALALLGWFLLGFLLYAALFGALGALVSRAEDAQGVATPMYVVAIAGYFVSFITLDDPTGTVARVATLVPFTAPFVVPIRVALDAIAWWELVLSVVLALVALVGCVAIGGRIYAGGALRIGSRVSVRDALQSPK